MKTPTIYVIERRMKRKGAQWQPMPGYAADTRALALNQLSYAQQDETGWDGTAADYHIARYVRVSPR
jgi:hypothetical protein